MTEDDPDDRMLAEQALAEAKLANDLHCVAAGEELMDYLRRRGNYRCIGDSPPPGLIPLNLNMPRKDGREALEEIKARKPAAALPRCITGHCEGGAGYLSPVRAWFELLDRQTRDLRRLGGRHEGPGRVPA